LKIYARKCVVFDTMVRCCRRLITKNAMRLDPKHMKALQTMREPQNGAALVQYVADFNWMRSAIPIYPKRVALFRQHWRMCCRVKVAELGLMQPRCRCYTFEDQRSKPHSNIYKKLS
jgi:hypothetical protein